MTLLNSPMVPHIPALLCGVVSCRPRGAVSLGSSFLFRPEAGRPAVAPLLAVLTSALTVGFFWLAVGKAIAAQREKPRIEPLDVVGRGGEGRTRVGPLGSVYVAGELGRGRA